MENDNVSKLSQLGAIQRRINSLEERIEELTEAATSIKGIAQAEKVQKSPSPPAWTAIVEEADELRREVDRLQVELVAAESEARLLISRLDVPMSRKILTEVYVNGRSVAEAASVMGYTIQHAYRIFNSARQAINNVNNM